EGIERRQLDRVAVHEKEVAVEQVAYAPERAAGAEDFRLVREVKPAVEGRREIALDEIGKVMQVDDDLVDAGAEGVLDRVSDERLVAQRHERFRQEAGDRAEPRAE